MSKCCVNSQVLSYHENSIKLSIMVFPSVSHFDELPVALFPDELDRLPAFPAGIALRIPFLNNIT